MRLRQLHCVYRQCGTRLWSGSTSRRGQILSGLQPGQRIDVIELNSKNREPELSESDG